MVYPLYRCALRRTSITQPTANTARAPSSSQATGAASPVFGPLAADDEGDGVPEGVGETVGDGTPEGAGDTVGDGKVVGVGRACAVRR